MLGFSVVSSPLNLLIPPLFVFTLDPNDGLMVGWSLSWLADGCEPIDSSPLGTT